MDGLCLSVDDRQQTVAREGRGGMEGRDGREGGTNARAEYCIHIVPEPDCCSALLNIGTGLCTVIYTPSEYQGRHLKPFTATFGLRDSP